MSGLSFYRPESVCPTACMLGEGPVWVGVRGELWFVDIKGRRIYRHHPDTNALKVWSAPAQVGWVLPAADGTMVAGLQGGVHRFDPTDGSFELLAEVEADRPSNRLNDAAADPEGRIWFGSMDDEEEAETGAFYRLDGGRAVPAGLDPVCITNGPAFSPDGRILYTVDTLGGTIHASEVGPDGAPGEPRVFARIPAEEGYPDGPTVDAEGHLWIGLFGGWQARRYAPDGELVRTVRFPVANVTKLAFGGEDLMTVYATTARKGLSDEALERQTDAGDLFAFRADVRGVAVTPARIR